MRFFFLTVKELVDPPETEVAEVARVGLAGYRSKNFSLLGSTLRIPRRRQVKERASFHGLEPDEAVEERVSKLSHDVVKPALGGALGDRVAAQQSFDTPPGTDHFL
jgi:hypothetical protein